MTITNAQILQSLQRLHEKVDLLMSQSDEVLQDAQALEDDVTKTNAGVQSAVTMIANLEAEVAAGQPVTPEALAALRQAVADVGTSSDSVAAIAPPAAPPAA